MSERVRKEEELLELGISGLNRQSGFIFEEFLRELQGVRGVKVYKEMRDNDSIVGAMLFAIEMLIRQADWRVEAESDSAEHVADKEFVEGVLEDMEMSWDETVSEILSMLPFGWAFHEIVYKKRGGINQDERLTSRFKDGLIGWRKLPLRAQETLWEWRFAEDGEVLSMIQQAPPDYKFREIPMSKALLFRTKIIKGNPEGRSILRNSYRNYYFKKHIENIEGIGIERDLAGLPVAYVPPELLKSNCSPEAKATLKQIETIIKNIRRDEQEGIIFPKAMDEKGNQLFELKLLSTGGQRQFDTDKIVGRHNQAIAASVLADFILLGHGSVGSFALSSDKTHLFGVAIGAWLKTIAAVMNTTAIPRLFKINGLQREVYPMLIPGDIETINLQEIGTFIQRITASGANIFPDPDIENFLLRSAGLPEKDHHNNDMMGFDHQVTESGLLAEIQRAVAAGSLEKATAKSWIKKGFGVDSDRADRILG